MPGNPSWLGPDKQPGSACQRSHLGINAFVNNLDHPSGVFVTSKLLVQAGNPLITKSTNDLADLVARMESGGVKALLLHRVNPNQQMLLRGIKNILT